jgi:hypothetical protein
VYFQAVEFFRLVPVLFAMFFFATVSRCVPATVPGVFCNGSPTADQPETLQEKHWGTAIPSLRKTTPKQHWLHRSPKIRP